MDFGKINAMYYDLTAQIVYALIFILFIELTVMSINDWKKGELKKRVIVGLLLLWVFVIFTALILFHVIK